jgi:hypothetical protein
MIRKRILEKHTQVPEKIKKESKKKLKIGDSDRE